MVSATWPEKDRSAHLQNDEAGRCGAASRRLGAATSRPERLPTALRVRGSPRRRHQHKAQRGDRHQRQHQEQQQSALPCVPPPERGRHHHLTPAQGQRARTRSAFQRVRSSVAGLGGGVVYAVLLVRADLEDLRPAVAAGRRAVDKLCAKLRLL